MWYRLNNTRGYKSTCLSKVYFTWVIRDFGSAEWFHSLLKAIEEQDIRKRIEINIYLTAKLKEDDMHNIIVNLLYHDVNGADCDTLFRFRMLELKRMQSRPSKLLRTMAGQIGTRYLPR